MSIQLNTALWVGGTLAFLYPIVGRVAGELVRPQRTLVSDLGDKLLSDPNVPDATKDVIRLQLKASISPWTVWAWVALFPIFLIITVWEQFSDKDKNHSDELSKVTQLKGRNYQDYRSFLSASILSIMASNVYGALVFVLLVLCAAPILSLCNSEETKTKKSGATSWNETTNDFAEALVERRLRACLA